ncbi:MAG: element excision factor XisI family protein [Planctomycetota bacterium]|jgi:hypothetical protein|nr:element excision factor XisI family protein [Planctomycetota bacterium]MDP6502019.1 element excision factor XisI family protein [Planctomycetota bacterium]
MDRVNQHHEIVADLVTQYAAEWKPHDGTSIEAVTDPDHGHYQIVRTGLKCGKFVYSCLVHLAIRGGKIELLKNETEVEWDRELVERAVAPQDIVLAFRESSAANVLS